MISTYASYRLASSDMTAAIERVQEQPIVSREVEYYLENIGNVKTIDEFLGDRRLFNFAMKAHGLEDMSYAKAFMRKVLEEGRAKSDSFANSLTDTRYREFAATYDFETFGDAATAFTKVQQGTVDKYLRQTLEEQAGEQNEGVRLALYFQRKAPDLTNYYQILADPALAQVARTALSLPDSIGASDIDKQKALLQKGFELEDFKDPAKLEEFLGRFTNLWELSNGSQQSSAVSQVGVLFGSSAQSGIGMDLMMQIQQLKR